MAPVTIDEGGTFGRMRAVSRLRAALEPSVKERSTGANIVVLVSLVLVLAALALRGTAWWHGNHGDLLDFVEGGRSILLGREIYAEIPGVMPFNYPPFGAVVMVPLALLGMPVAFPVLTALSVLSYAVIVVAVAKVAHVGGGVASVVGLGGLALEPIFRTVVLGQVNLCLAALVVLDVFVLPRRVRGVLVGVAAGIKLTPAIFGIYFLYKKDWAAAARCAGAFALTIVGGWFLAPQSSLQYWFNIEWLQRFVADAMVIQNQSLRASLVRVAGAAVPEIVVAGLTAIVAVAGLLAVRRQLRAGADLAAVIGLAALSLVLSPISWTHHWVWVVPGLLLLVATHRWIAAWTVGAVFFLAPMWFVAGNGAGGQGLSVPDLILSCSYLWVGLVAISYLLLAAPLVVPVPDSRTRRPAEAPPVDRARLSA
jgi:alpha-1,2-mannosyltransferase